jgi:hypothetical protein
MAHAQASTESLLHDRRARAQACRELAMKAEGRAAQATDPDMRRTFLSMKQLWLDLANEIERRQEAA